MQTTSSAPEASLPVRQLTEKEASTLTGYSVSWFQRKRWEGGGPIYRKIGKSIRYPEDLLIQWIESHGLRQSTAMLPKTAKGRRAGARHEQV
jgi:predicted DNA-binding transcriptional regulator AlpA